MPRRLIRRLGIPVMLALASIPFLPPPPVGATIVSPATLAELAVGADAIARGRIVRIDARQTNSLRVERLITFEPVEYLKGNLGGAIQFRLPGGTFGRYRTITVGSPEFREGDEVVLFLGLRGESLPVLLGFHQGVYRLVADPATGQRVVTPPLLQDVAAGQAAGQSVPIVRGDETRRALPWTQFQAQVGAALAAAAQAPAPAAASAVGPSPASSAAPLAAPKALPVQRRKR